MSSDLKYVLLFVVVFSVTFVVGTAAIQLMSVVWRARKRRGR